ncbi:MAG: TonB-dependent receptor [Cyclobacteriaceae bacterium]
MKYWLLTGLLIAGSMSCFAQHTLSGYVRDADTGEDLIGVTILDIGSKKGAVTNAYGFYSITPNVDSLNLRITYVGYHTLTQKIYLDSSIQVDFKMLPAISTLDDIVISAERFLLEEEVTSTETGVFNLQPKEAMVIPTIAGESDILKVAQLMPGITKGGEGTTGIYVRGGTDDQNLVTLDEATVYNVGHLLGFLSVFNSDVIKNVKVVKGGFPADYGGRLSSVIDTRMDDGSTERFHAKGGIGLLSSRLRIDGPIVEDKASFMIAGRRAYIDKVFGIFNVPFPYYFYDLNAKVNYKINKRNRVYLSSYFGRDVFAAPEEVEDDFQGGFDLGNFTSTLRWNHVSKGQRLFANFTAIQTRFQYDIDADVPDNSLLIKSHIQDWGLKADWDYYKSPEERIEFGVHTTTHLFRPNVVNTTGEISDFLKSKKGKRLYTQETAAYAGIEKTFAPKLKGYAGLRASSSAVEKAFYYGLEPRLNANYALYDLTSIKASYSLMRQYMHRVSSSSLVLPTDLWYPVTASILPQTSHQWSLGIFQGLKRWNLNASVEGYYKTMSNLIEYREGARLILNDNFENELVTGSGEAYGVEFLIRKQTGPVTGWVSYTLSKTTRQFDDLNNGQRFPGKYDHTHDISIVNIIKISKRMDMSWVWTYTTGASFTPQTGQYLVPNATLTEVELIPIYSSRNAVKLSPSHRLDINLIVKPKKEKRIKGEWQFGVYNFYNQTTPNQIRINSNGKSLQYVQSGIFGFLPSVAYNFNI